MFTNEVSVWSNILGIPSKCVLGWPQRIAIVVFAREDNIPARGEKISTERKIFSCLANITWRLTLQRFPPTPLGRKTRP
jgi:hypothetical protein